MILTEEKMVGISTMYRILPNSFLDQITKT